MDTAADSAASALSGTKPRIVYGLLALIILAGLALRFYGIGWSLPDERHPTATFHPDERINFQVTQNVDISTGKLDTGFYNYGTFYYYITNLAQIIGRGYGAIPRTPALPAGTPPLAHIQESERTLPEVRAEYLTGRVVSALMGVFTIPVLFALACRLYGVETGLVSALIYAVLPLAVLNAHFYTVDVGATLFVSLALLWSARILGKQSWREYLAAGIWIGLAAATKYSAGLVLVAPVTAHILVLKRRDNSRPSPGGLAVLMGAAIAAFLIACPGPIINWSAFWEGLPGWAGSGVRYELLQHPREGHGLLFVNTGPGWWYHLVISLRYGVGLPLLALMAAGIIIAARAGKEADRLLLAFVLVFYVLTSFSAVRFARYMLPLYPALSILAARTALTVKQQSAARWAAYLAMSCAVLLTALYTTSIVHAMSVRDPRDSAADYLMTHALQGASIAFAKTPWFFSPPLSPWFGEMSAAARAKCLEDTRFKFLLPTNPAEFDSGILNPPPDYTVLSNIETVNEVRLKQSAPERFVSAIPSEFVKQEFNPAGIFDVAMFRSDLIPDDLLYVLPKITLYKKP